MALLYLRNGLQRANPRWHSNQSLSITVMTDFSIINTPAVLHMESATIVSTCLHIQGALKHRVDLYSDRCQASLTYAAAVNTEGRSCQ